jgi:hypothetical protein
MHLRNAGDGKGEVENAAIQRYNDDSRVRIDVK